jgi:hypothetical protein
MRISRKVQGSLKPLTTSPRPDSISATQVNSPARLSRAVEGYGPLKPGNRRFSSEPCLVPNPATARRCLSRHAPVRKISDDRNPPVSLPLLSHHLCTQQRFFVGPASVVGPMGSILPYPAAPHPAPDARLAASTRIRACPPIEQAGVPSPGSRLGSWNLELGT